MTAATRPDMRDARAYPYPGRRWAARKREMRRFGAAIATYEADPELNPVLVVQARAGGPGRRFLMAETITNLITNPITDS